MLLTDRNFNTTFFDPAGGGGSYIISTFILVFWAPRGIYINFAGVWDGFSNNTYVCG